MERDDLFVPALAEEEPKARKGGPKHECIPGLDPGTELGLTEKIRHDELVALREVGEALGWWAWTNKHGWGSPEMHHSRMHGVTVGIEPEDAGHVIELTLESNGLRGTIPPAIGAFPRLQKLMLHGNDIGGTLPTEIGQCTELKWLSVSNNRLSGTVPESIGKCTKLLTVSLQGNQFSGALESLFPLCSCGPQLYCLRASGNRITVAAGDRGKVNLDCIESIRGIARGRFVSATFDLNTWAAGAISAMAPRTLEIGDMLAVTLTRVEVVEGNCTIVTWDKHNPRRHVFDFKLKVHWVVSNGALPARACAHCSRRSPCHFNSHNLASTQRMRVRLLRCP